eukprot:CAMPEP_0115370678 /NCGR_PEP_ID=MMETSP0270-20121206/106954_1 /TAXON_ID=71861 /ORGANISM="Scrippsiella trochoidea, Strain CCMP3099" /LENGTH=315 /DNA_ID=CAMNT_0002793507 /DNA_START=122 /DNA_END=1067 /DNA_ORIENTATION=-
MDIWLQEADWHRLESLQLRAQHLCCRFCRRLRPDIQQSCEAHKQVPHAGSKELQLPRDDVIEVREDRDRSGALEGGGIGLFARGTLSAAVVVAKSAAEGHAPLPQVEAALVASEALAACREALQGMSFTASQQRTTPTRVLAGKGQLRAAEVAALQRVRGGCQGGDKLAMVSVPLRNPSSMEAAHCNRPENAFSAREALPASGLAQDMLYLHHALQDLCSPPLALDFLASEPKGWSSIPLPSATASSSPSPDCQTGDKGRGVAAALGGATAPPSLWPWPDEGLGTASPSRTPHSAGAGCSAPLRAAPLQHGADVV